MWGLFSCFFLFAFAEVGAVIGDCLDDAIPSAIRQNITIGGVARPFALYDFNWASAQISAEMVRIAVAERLGFNSVHFGTANGTSVYSETRHAYLSTMSCKLPWDWSSGAPDCDEANQNLMRDTMAHAALEFWTNYQGENDGGKWKMQAPERVPIEAGSIGYKGGEGVYIPRRVHDHVLNTTGQDLAWYSTWETKWNNPSQYFVAEKDLPQPLDCQSFIDRVSSDLVDLGMSCTNGWWHWGSCTSCADGPCDCVPVVFAIDMPSYACFKLWKAHNMHGMIGWYEWGDYTSIPLNTDLPVPFYGYTPDATFLDIEPVRIWFPEHNPRDWEGEWPSTDLDDTQLTKVVASSLSDAAPVLVKYLNAFEIHIGDMNAILADCCGPTGDWDVTRAICHWMRSNKPTWESQLPDPTDCVVGQGLQSDGEANLITACQFCVPGKFSHRSAEDRKLYCVDCPRGRFQERMGATSCRECAPGMFSDQTGAVTCKLCTVNSWNDKAAQDSCTECPANTATVSVGSVSIESCVCDAGFYGTPDYGRQSTCFECPALHESTIGTARSSDCAFSAEGWVLVTAAMLVTFGSAGGFVLYRRLKRTYQRKMEQVLEKELTSALEVVKMLKHPLVLVSSPAFVDMDWDTLKSLPEGCRNIGHLVFLDTMDIVDAFKLRGKKILFFSYQWLSFVSPGPNQLQLECMKSACDSVITRYELESDQLYAWLDILSIPQCNSTSKGLAVYSLYTFATQADVMAIITPESKHEQLMLTANVHTYKKRVWCRAEQMAFFTFSGTEQLFLVAGPKQFSVVPDGWIQDVACIFNGDMTCCTLKHEGMAKCDRESLVSPLLGLFFDLYTKMKADKLNQQARSVWDFVHDQQDVVFPKQFDFVAKSKSGGDKVVRKTLFGDMIGRVEQFVVKDIEAALEMSSGTKKKGGQSHSASHDNASVLVPEASPHQIVSKSLSSGSRSADTSDIQI